MMTLVQECEGRRLKRKWTAEEDACLVSFVCQYGHVAGAQTPSGQPMWSKMREAMPGALPHRDPKACRLRWNNHLRPGIRKGSLTPQEQQQVKELHSIHGNKWALIASALPGRSDNSVKNWWNAKYGIKAERRVGSKGPGLQHAGTPHNNNNNSIRSKDSNMDGNRSTSNCSSSSAGATSSGAASLSASVSASACASSAFGPGSPEEGHSQKHSFCQMPPPLMSKGSGSPFPAASYASLPGCIQGVPPSTVVPAPVPPRSATAAVTTAPPSHFKTTNTNNGSSNNNNSSNNNVDNSNSSNAGATGLDGGVEDGLTATAGGPQAVDAAWDQLLMAFFDKDDVILPARGEPPEAVSGDDVIPANEGVLPATRKDDDIIKATEGPGPAAEPVVESDDDVIEVTEGALPRAAKASGDLRSMPQAGSLSQASLSHSSSHPVLALPHSLPHSSSHPVLTLPHSLPHSFPGPVAHTLPDTDLGFLYPAAFYTYEWPAQAYADADLSRSQLHKAGAPTYWGSWAPKGPAAGARHASAELAPHSGADLSPSGVDRFKAGMDSLGAWAHHAGGAPAPSAPHAISGVGRGRAANQQQRTPSGVPQAAGTMPAPAPAPSGCGAPQRSKGQGSRGKLKGVPVSRVRPPSVPQSVPPGSCSAHGLPVAESSHAAQEHQRGPEAAGVPVSQTTGMGPARRVSEDPSGSSPKGAAASAGNGQAAGVPVGKASGVGLADNQESEDPTGSLTMGAAAAEITAAGNGQASGVLMTDTAAGKGQAGSGCAAAVDEQGLTCYRASPTTGKEGHVPSEPVEQVGSVPGERGGGVIGAPWGSEGVAEVLGKEEKGGKEEQGREERRGEEGGKEEKERNDMEVDSGERKEGERGKGGQEEKETKAESEEGGNLTSPTGGTAPVPPAMPPLGSSQVTARSHVSCGGQHLSSITGAYPWGHQLLSLTGADYSDTWHTADGGYSDTWHTAEGCYSDTWPAVTMAAPAGDPSTSGAWYQPGGSWPYCGALCGTPPEHPLNPTPTDISGPAPASASGTSQSCPASGQASGPLWAHQSCFGAAQGHGNQMGPTCAMSPFFAYSQGLAHPGLTPSLAPPGIPSACLAPAPSASLQRSWAASTGGVPLDSLDSPVLVGPRGLGGALLPATWQEPTWQAYGDLQQQLLQMRLQAQAQGLLAVHSSSRLDVSGAPSVYPRSGLRPRGGRGKRGLAPGGAHEGDGRGMGQPSGPAKRQKGVAGSLNLAAGDPNSVVQPSSSATSAQASKSATSAPQTTTPPSPTSTPAQGKPSARPQVTVARPAVKPAGKTPAKLAGKAASKKKARRRQQRPFAFPPLSEAFREQDTLECLLPPLRLPGEDSPMVHPELGSPMVHPELGSPMAHPELAGPTVPPELGSALVHPRLGSPMVHGVGDSLLEHTGEGSPFSSSNSLDHLPLDPSVVPFPAVSGVPRANGVSVHPHSDCGLPAVLLCQGKDEEPQLQHRVDGWQEAQGVEGQQHAQGVEGLQEAQGEQGQQKLQPNTSSGTESSNPSGVPAANGLAAPPAEGTPVLPDSPRSPHQGPHDDVISPPRRPGDDVMPLGLSERGMPGMAVGEVIQRLAVALKARTQAKGRPSSEGEEEEEAAGEREGELKLELEIPMVGEEPPSEAEGEMPEALAHPGTPGTESEPIELAPHLAVVWPVRPGSPAATKHNPSGVAMNTSTVSSCSPATPTVRNTGSANASLASMSAFNTTLVSGIGVAASSSFLTPPKNLPGPGTSRAPSLSPSSLTSIPVAAPPGAPSLSPTAPKSPSVAGIARPSKGWRGPSQAQEAGGSGALGGGEGGDIVTETERVTLGEPALMRWEAAGATVTVTGTVTGTVTDTVIGLPVTTMTNSLAGTVTGTQARTSVLAAEGAAEVGAEVALDCLDVFDGLDELGH